MKTHIRNLSLILACIELLLVSAAAQTFTVLHSFTAAEPDDYTNSDGGIPLGRLILSGNTLYGTTELRGGFDRGTIFAINTDSTGFTNLYNFVAGFDGGEPAGGLAISGNVLYGTTQVGGSGASGTIFTVNTDGTGFTVLYNFTPLIPGPPYFRNNDGARPRASLILSNNTLYGTALFGGAFGNGTVFKVNTDGTGFTVLHTFTVLDAYGRNNDGAYPYSGLVLSGNTLYGTAPSGGSSACGTIFAVNTDGNGFTNLYDFTGGSDGANPWAGLILSGNTLYGTASGGGSSGQGTVFAINTDGTGFANLYSFTGTNNGGIWWNSTRPGLVLSGKTLYGATENIGSFGYGAVFKINTDGTGFTNLYNFTGGSDGSRPYAELVLSGNTLYGTTPAGGSSSNGVIFKLSLGLTSAPQLAIIHSGTNVILTWPTNVSGYTLQSAANLIPSTVWNTVSPPAVVVNGQNTVTNPISGVEQFYRLSQ